jgi:hypothetical protein
VQDPPFENISFEHLTWTQKPGSTGLFGYLPVHRLEDFRRGWGQECNSHFFIYRSKHWDRRKNRPTKISSRTVFSETTLWFQYGPTNNGGAAKVQQLQAGQRRSSIAAGESVKVGCRAHFTAKVYYNEQSVVEINIEKVGCRLCTFYVVGYCQKCFLRSSLCNNSAVDDRPHQHCECWTGYL